MSWVWLIFRQPHQWEFVDVWKHSGVTIVANGLGAIPRTPSTFWWVTRHPGSVVIRIQLSYIKRTMFLAISCGPRCPKWMIRTFCQVVKKTRSTLETTWKIMAISAFWQFVRKTSNWTLKIVLVRRQSLVAKVVLFCTVPAASSCSGPGRVWIKTESGRGNSSTIYRNRNIWKY